MNINIYTWEKENSFTDYRRVWNWWDRQCPHVLDVDCWLYIFVQSCISKRERTWH